MKVTFHLPKPLKRIISFGLWGDTPIYLVGAQENVRLCSEVYSGWTCRFYVDDSVSEKVLSSLETHGAEVVQKGPSDGAIGLFWRFEPLLDRTIERFIVRDCDSRLNAREARAVQEWIDSGKAFHSMRDHPFHGIPVMGGMWGSIPYIIPNIDKILDDFKNKAGELFIRRSKYFHTDQIFLCDVLWPLIKDKALVHDDRCMLGENDRPFTVKLPEGQFVGQQWGADNIPLIAPR